MDSLAALGFFTLVAGASEALIARMAREQVMASRLTAVPVMLATGRPYGTWRDRVLAALPPRGSMATAAVDVLAFTSFQVPVHAAILRLAGASGTQMAAALGSATVGMVLLSRPYGLWLDWLRRACGVAPSAAVEG